jgi:glucokinase
LEAEASGTAIRAITGSDPAVATLAIRERTGQLVGRAIGSIATLLDCENFFVAGSVALGYGTPFFEAALQGARQTGRVSYLANLTISPSGMGANGPLLGAAAVALNGAVQ